MTGIDLAQLAVGAPLVGVGISFGFVVVKWTANFIAGRLDKKADRNEATTEFLIGQLTGQVETLLNRCTQIEAHHAHCLEELASLRGYADGKGDARNDAAAIVARDRVADKRGKP